MSSQPAKRSYLRGYRLSRAERQKLLFFLAGHRHWALRHSVSLQEVVTCALRNSWLEVLSVHQELPHPLFVLGLRLGRSSPSTKQGIAAAVTRAFAVAGRKVGRDYVHVEVRGQRATVTVCAG